MGGGIDQENEDDQETEEQDNTAGKSYPIDKGWAWVIVLGCFGVLGLVVGGIKSFGVLLVEISRKTNAPAKLVTLTQSMAGFLHIALAPLSNALSDRFSHRIIIIVGGLVTGIGFIATSFVNDVGWLFVTYGLITGVGFGLAVSPSLVMMGCHFNKRRALANGLSDSGIGVGSFIFPNLLRVIMTEYGLQGCFLIIGAIMFNICVFGVLFRPLDFWNKRKAAITEIRNEDIPLLQRGGSLSREMCRDSEDCETIVNDQEAYNDARLCLKSSKSMSELQPNEIAKQCNNMSLPCLTSEQIELEFRKTAGDKMGTKERTNTADKEFLRTRKGIQQTYEESNKSLNDSSRNCCNMSLEWRFLRNIHFLLFNFSLICGVIGQHTVFNCLPSLASEIGLSDDDGAFLVSVVGISDLTGKIFFGWFSDLGVLQRQTVFHMNLGIFSFFTFFFPHFHMYAVLCVISALAGFFSGGYIGIEIAVLADKFGAEHLSSTWGFVAFFGSFAMLVNPFISGLLKDTTGSWINPFYFSATSAAVGFSLLVIDVILDKKQQKHKVIK